MVGVVHQFVIVYLESRELSAPVIAFALNFFSDDIDSFQVRLYRQCLIVGHQKPKVLVFDCLKHDSLHYVAHNVAKSFEHFPEFEFGAFSPHF